eukprot:TRINITY_DN15662_c0_g1_i1.p2 TRINITY_DN15662_c0_g1~~TRINITY_DN15662_c0_g1_i1.p2  ORF type:complete len:103 (-),score=9.36 TRINITY_DN15662_c0_g1_i1:130-438(-)
MTLQCDGPAILSRTQDIHNFAADLAWQVTKRTRQPNPQLIRTTTRHSGAADIASLTIQSAFCGTMCTNDNRAEQSGFLVHPASNFASSGWLCVTIRTRILHT